MTVSEPRGTLRIGAAAMLLAMVGIAFPLAFALAVTVGGLLLIFWIGHYLGGYLLKLLWVLVFPLFAALRGLWIPPVIVDGEPVAESQAPELFATIERLRAEAKAARIDAVYLTGELNASMAQLPRFGVFGGTRNELRLGIPLMVAMDEPHFVAVLAHEIGHLARRGGSWAARIYAMRKTLETMLVELARHGSPLVHPIALFYRAYVPCFDRVTLAHSRAVEIEADAGAAAVVGSRIAAETLVVLTGIATYFAEHVWPAISARSAAEPEPPADVFAVMAEQFRTPLHEGRQFVENALAVPAAEDDTHPSLAERLRFLGVPPAELVSALDRYAVPERSAADVFLRGATAQRRTLAYEWNASVRGEWRVRHAELVRLRARLNDLDALGAGATAEQRRERALAATELGREDGIALITEVSDAEPSDGEVALRAGVVLADADDDRAPIYLDRAIAAGPATTPVAANRAREFFRWRGDLERARQYAARFNAWAASMHAAERERSVFTGTEPIEPHGLDDAQLAPFRHALDLPGIVVAAYLARWRVTHLEEVPNFVLAVRRKKTKNGAGDDEIAKVIANEFGAFPYSVTVVVSSRSRDAAVDAVAAVEGTELTL